MNNLINKQNEENKELIAKIDEALKKEGLPQNELNKLIKMVEEKVRCDADCQRKNDLNNLKKKWKKAEADYQALPDQIDIDEKNYYILAKGKDFYKNNILKNKYNDIIKQFIFNEKKEINNLKPVITSMNSSYKTETIAKSRIQQLLDDLLNKNKQLKLDIDNFYKKTFTDERKVFYEDQNINNLIFYRYFINIAYFFIIIILVIFGSYFRSTDSFKIIFIKILLLLIFIAIPFFLRFFINKILEIYKYYI